MKQQKKEIKKLTLNRVTVTNLDDGEMAAARGGENGSVIFTLCLCLTKFCTNTCA